MKAPYVNFGIGADQGSAACAAGAGTGSFTFTRFDIPDGGYVTPPIEGYFDFSCPDAGIAVFGCFHYGTL